MEWRVNKEEAEKVGSEYEGGRSKWEIEDGNYEDNEVKTDNRNGEHSTSGEVKLRLATSINFMYNTFYNIYFLSYGCSKIMKSIHEIAFSVKAFPRVRLSNIQNPLPFR
jgi:hypothetical protein